MTRAAIATVVSISLMGAGVVASSGQRFVYVVTSNQQFGTVNLATGAFYQIGPQTPEGQANLVWGPDDLLYSLTFSGNLERIDPATGQTSVVGQTGLYFNAFDLAGVSGQLYATDFANNLYAVDSHTGAATLISATGVPPDPNVPFTTNGDGTINLCDESLYGFGGRLYATFDSFTLDPGTLATTPVVPPALYEIDPRSGMANQIAPTVLNLGAAVQLEGRFYGFQWVPTGFTAAGPQIATQLVALDVTDGSVQPLTAIDPTAGGITGAAPVRSDR
jgi:hypothetical protein